MQMAEEVSAETNILEAEIQNLHSLVCKGYKDLASAHASAQDELERDREALNDRADALQQEILRMKEIFKFQSNNIHVNVGGTRFETSNTTLESEEGSMLAAMFSGRH
eukprot:CAMPEP_0184558170 /NCGR_PEP_ID=MMETSP0199_2-20130426/44762_1 /TAXON_ID=1112570 /ORGANISM="Thraustochytrium sp., Strain LLF1b" /LENGTH=107 /DNA_ID=CAMNT_0026955287 /DNA_START=235 /DNA_END=556 /DNA_ORIENTATION=-